MDPYVDLDSRIEPTMESVFQFFNGMQQFQDAEDFQKKEIDARPVKRTSRLSVTEFERTGPETFSDVIVNPKAREAFITPMTEIMSKKMRKRKAEEYTKRTKRSKVNKICFECNASCEEIRNSQMLQKFHPEYGNSFYCDECELTSPSWPMFHCRSCEYDVCFICGTKNKDIRVDKRAHTSANVSHPDENLGLKADFIANREEATLVTPTAQAEDTDSPPKLQLTFAVLAVNPPGFQPRFYTKQDRSFESVKRSLLNQEALLGGRGKGNLLSRNT